MSTLVERTVDEHELEAWRRGRRRRLLEACRYRSASIDLRRYVRAIERVIDR